MLLLATSSSDGFGPWRLLLVRGGGLPRSAPVATYASAKVLTKLVKEFAGDISGNGGVLVAPTTHKLEETEDMIVTMDEELAGEPLQSSEH